MYGYEAVVILAPAPLAYVSTRDCRASFVDASLSDQAVNVKSLPPLSPEDESESESDVAGAQAASAPAPSTAPVSRKGCAGRAGWVRMAGRRRRRVEGMTYS